jgi:hypothetical protein
MDIKKLTPTEITEVVEKIRKRYDEYIYKYFKPKTLRGAFEERYLDALRSKADISSFLLAEISVIEELIAREEKKVMSMPFKKVTRKKKSIADRVVEENRRRIQKYEDIPIHNDANEEVRRLLGALNELDTRYWGALAVVLRNTPYSMNSLQMVNLESQLRHLSSLTDDGVPQRLESYLSLLRAFPRDYHAIDREEKEYILEVAFFLHDLADILEVVRKSYEDIESFKKDDLDKIIDFVNGIIADFRLKELKRMK